MDFGPCPDRLPPFIEDARRLFWWRNSTRFAAELLALSGRKDVAVYGIGRELPFTMSAWSQKMGLDFPLLSDATLVVAEVRRQALRVKARVCTGRPLDQIYA